MERFAKGGEEVHRDSGEVEGVKHFLMRCEAWNGEREELMGKMKEVVTGFDEVEEERYMALNLDLACRNDSIARGVENLRTAMFMQKGRPGICIFPSRIHHLTLTSDPHLLITDSTFPLLSH